MTTQQLNVSNEFSRLGVNNFVPQQYSPNSAKKFAPVVPPKPPKKNGGSANETAALESDQIESIPKGTASSSGVLTVKIPYQAGPVSGANARDNHSGARGDQVPNYWTDYSNASNYSSSNYSNAANYSDSSNFSTYSGDNGSANYNGLSGYTAYTPPPTTDDNDLPLPPPPAPSDFPSTPVKYAGEDLPPPPSPVSSSYSELRRHNTNSQNYNYATYAPPSIQSSNYESIYEPINPHPLSQISNRSNYGSVYSGYGGKQSDSGSEINYPVTAYRQMTAEPTSGKKAVKEDEVDALTDLLVQNLDHSNDPEFFGVCARCRQKVVGEGNGCTAMDQVYHISCFTCCVCENLLQGKPFYAVDGKPYCEADYLNTLEKCNVCQKPILDRILRATGKPYHPQCFTCVVCRKSLDGIPFTVDAANQIHCIECFHRKFAPRCCVCKHPIMPEPGQSETVRVVAMDKSYHVGCYTCEDCGLVLSSESEGRGCYPLDDHILCKGCNARRVQTLTSRMIS